jgi:hypothetical protein
MMMAPVLEKVGPSWGTSIRHRHGLPENTAVGLLTEKRKTLARPSPVRAVCSQSASPTSPARRAFFTAAPSRTQRPQKRRSSGSTRVSSLKGRCQPGDVAERWRGVLAAVRHGPRRWHYGRRRARRGRRGRGARDGFVALASDDCVWCRSLSLAFGRDRVRSRRPPRAGHDPRYLTGLPVTD